MITRKKSRTLCYLGTIAFLFVAVSLCAGCSQKVSSLSSIEKIAEINSKINPDSLPIAFRGTTYAVDRSDAGQCVAIADYVFVGRVDSYDGVTYEDLQEIETEHGMKMVGDPYSKYTITVMENIKGGLVLGEPIPMQKAGGVRTDGKAVEVDEKDNLPDVGNVYVFLVFAQPDGITLLISGANSNVLVESGLSKNLAEITAEENFNEEEISEVLANSRICTTYSREAEKDELGKIDLPDYVEKAEEKSGTIENAYDESNK
jgi:hypothetical protein